MMSRLALAGLVSSSIAGAVSAQSLHGIGLLPDGWSSTANAVSGDGKVVVGNAQTRQGTRAVRWTLQSGIEVLPVLPNTVTSVCWSVNRDGSVCVGDCELPSPRAVRWTKLGLEPIGTLPGCDSATALAVNDDGTVITGYASGDGKMPGFRWTASAGMQALPTPPDWQSCNGFAISGDGNVIAGIGHSATRLSCAFRWTASDGVQDLGTLRGGSMACAQGMSRDGTTVVGFSSGVADGSSPVSYTHLTLPTILRV